MRSTTTSTAVLSSSVISTANRLINMTARPIPLGPNHSAAGISRTQRQASVRNASSVRPAEASPQYETRVARINRGNPLIEWKSVVEGKSVSVREKLGGRSLLHTQHNT